MRRFAHLAARAVAFAALLASPHAHAAAPRDGATIRIPAILVVDSKLDAPHAGLSDLKFQDVFKLPVGPKGLEPTARLLELDGKRVRIVGYMVRQESPATDAFLFSPLPVLLGDEDESLADDLPPSTIRIDLPTSHGIVVPMLPGLLQLTGILHVGMRTDATTGRATPAQLTLDARPERALRRLASASSANARKKLRQSR
jgi:hypothetical protein